MTATAIDEILDFVTSAPTLEQIVDFEHNDTTKERVAYLREREIESTISEEEEAELREFEGAAEFMSQLKIRAKRRLGLPT